MIWLELIDDSFIWILESDFSQGELISIYQTEGLSYSYHQYLLIKTTPRTPISSVAEVQHWITGVINFKWCAIRQLMTITKNKLILSTSPLFLRCFFCLSPEIKRVLTMFVNHSSGSLLVGENGDFKIMFTKQNISSLNVFE